MMTLGDMPMPADFKYRRVYERGRPQHAKWDPFYAAHPPMTANNWAKIFSPFDALKGFNEEIRAKETVYVPRQPVDETDLDRKLEKLYALTWNGRVARRNQVRVTLQYFSPVDALLGLYKSADGIVTTVDADISHSLTVQTDAGKLTIAFSDILEIESPVFENVMDA